MAVTKSERETRQLLKSPDYAEWEIDRFVTEPTPPVLQRIIENVEGEFLTWQQWKVKHVWAKSGWKSNEHTQTVEQQLQEGVHANSAPLLTLCFRLQTQVPRIPKIGVIGELFTGNGASVGEVNPRNVFKQPKVTVPSHYLRYWTVLAPNKFASYPRIEEIEDKALKPSDLFFLRQNPKISLDPINVTDNATKIGTNTVYLEVELMSLYAYYKFQEDKYRSKAESVEKHFA